MRPKDKDPNQQSRSSQRRLNELKERLAHSSPEDLCPLPPLRRTSPVIETDLFPYGITGAWKHFPPVHDIPRVELLPIQRTTTAGSQPSHTLIIGGTGSGKTRRWIAPASTWWSGPVLITTTKTELPDILNSLGRDLIAPHARKMIWSPVPTPIPKGWETIRWDPVLEVHDSFTATTVASDLVSLFGLSSSGAERFWEQQGSILLEPFLLVASALHQDTAWVFQRLVAGPTEWKEVIDALDTIKAHQVAERLLGQMTAAASDGGRRVDSAAATAATAVAGWRNQSTTDELSPLNLHDWAYSNGDVLIVTVPTEYTSVFAPAVIALIDAAIRHAKTANEDFRRRQLPERHFGIFMDEMANLSPLPKLPTYLAELRGHGITLIGALQHSTQFRRWGSLAETLTYSWPITLVHARANEIDLAGRISRAHGSHQVPKQSISKGPRQNLLGRNRTVSTHLAWEPVLRPEEIFSGPTDAWSVLEGGLLTKKVMTLDSSHTAYQILLAQLPEDKVLQHRNH